MKIQIFHTGKVHVSPYLPFGGENCSVIKASGFITPKKDWLWLPVSAYLIEHPNGKKILVLAGKVQPKIISEDRHNALLK